MKTFVYTIISHQTWKVEAETQEEAVEAVEAFASKIDQAVTAELLTDEAVEAVEDDAWEYLFEYEEEK